MHDKRIQWIYNIIDTFLSIIRVLSLSHFKKTRQIQKRHDKCILFGNGPSLLATMQKYENTIYDYDIIAVNQMAVTDEFEKYQPSVYIIADPGYWYEKGYEKEFYYADELYNALFEKTSWKLQLYMPYQANKQQVITQLCKNPNIKIVFYNKTTFSGYKKISYFIYNRQWGMVRPQNILLVALMLLIYSKYKTILLAGADTDWMKDIWVDEQNQLRIHDSHFYNEDYQSDRVFPFSMTEISAIFYYIFKNYSVIEEYSKHKKIKIYNLYPRSFIDAFEKIQEENIIQ